MTISQRLKNDVLIYMNSLLREAYEIKDSDDVELKRQLGERYISIRDDAISLGADVSRFPKKINYHTIRKKETSKEREVGIEKKLEEMQQRAIKANGQFFEEKEREYSEIESKLREAKISIILAKVTRDPNLRIEGSIHGIEALIMLSKQSEFFRVQGGVVK